jgi:hypothetical protein
MTNGSVLLNAMSGLNAREGSMDAVDVAAGGCRSVAVRRLRVDEVEVAPEWRMARHAVHTIGCILSISHILMIHERRREKRKPVLVCVAIAVKSYRIE